MANKKYTLYFRGKNKYGHIHEVPIVSLRLKNLDMYTSNYIDYVDLYNNFPISVATFIKQELGFDIDFESNDDLERCFFIADNDYKPIMSVIFEDDIDVLYVEPKELSDLICKVKMNYSDFHRTLLNISTSTVDKKKYQFFKYLYETYVKESPILKMIDTYDVKRNLVNLNYDDMFVAAIATDSSNIMVLSKKLSQTIESRRNLAFSFKHLFKTLTADGGLIDYSSMIERKNKDFDMDFVLEEMIDTVKEYKKDYNKKYELAWYGLFYLTYYVLNVIINYG